MICDLKGNILEDNDVYKEKIVIQRWTLVDYLKLLFLVLLFFAVLITVYCKLNLPFIFPYIVILASFLFYFSARRLRKEYEYSYVNGELKIDCIYSKSFRKEVLTINNENIIRIYRSEPPNSDFRRARLLDCSSKSKTANFMFILANIQDKKIVAKIDEFDVLGNSRKISK